MIRKFNFYNSMLASTIEHSVQRGIDMLRKLIHFFSCYVFGRRRHRVSSGIRTQQRKQLRAMSDLELRDLGIGRGEIPALMQSELPICTEDRWGNRHRMPDTARLEDDRHRQI
jgi:hypothetical protein